MQNPFLTYANNLHAAGARLISDLQSGNWLNTGQMRGAGTALPTTTTGTPARARSSAARGTRSRQRNRARSGATTQQPTLR